MTFQGRSEELVSRCVECDLAEPESLASLGGSAPGVVDGILSIGDLVLSIDSLSKIFEHLIFFDLLNFQINSFLLFVVAIVYIKL